MTDDERFSIECDEGECTIWFKKPYLVDISEEAQYVIVMEIVFISGVFFFFISYFHDNNILRLF